MLETQHEEPRSPGEQSDGDVEVHLLCRCVYIVSALVLIALVILAAAKFELWFTGFGFGE